MSIYFSIELTISLYTNNYAANYGSSLHIDLSSKFDITNATFSNNNNYRLSPISPARYKENPDSEYCNTNGTRNDMGAFGCPLGGWFED